MHSAARAAAAYHARGKRARIASVAAALARIEQARSGTPDARIASASVMPTGPAPTIRDVGFQCRVRRQSRRITSSMSLTVFGASV